jgi:hypothetical protein
MTTKEILRSQFPSTINKNAENFAALIANEQGTAAIESVLTDLLAYMKEWSSTNNIYEQSGTFLEKTINFFSYLTSYTNETEQSLKNRFASVFIRQGDIRWGTKLNIEHIFAQYFTSSKVYVQENVNDINLIQNGDFNSSTTNWSLTNAFLSEDARFSESNGVEFSANGEIHQTVTCEANKYYYLHFFSNDSIKVRIKSNSDNYWNPDTRVWDSNIHDIEFNNTDWEECSLWFLTDNNNSDVTIYFVADEGYLDYIALYEKLSYPTFTVLVQYSAENGTTSLALAPGTNDPIKGDEPWPEYYENFGYFNHTFLTGVNSGRSQEIYQDLLDYVKPQGVKASLKIIIRNSMTINT